MSAAIVKEDIILNIITGVSLFEGTVGASLMIAFMGVLFGYLRQNKRLKSLEKTLVITRKEAIERTNETTELKLDFLANMSREIRTPMNGIIGMTNLLLESKLAAEQRAYAGTVAKAADSLLDLFNDILDFSRIEAGGMALEIIPFDLQALMEEVAKLLALKAQEKDVELILRYAPHTPRYVLGDPGRIHQIILNLTNNALKYTHAGHVLINVEATGETNNNEVTFHVVVEDTGIGIEDIKQAHIFNKFDKRAGTDAFSPGTRDFGGTILGLALSREFVEMMGGEIRVESTPGVGSVFSFDLKLMRNISKETPREINYDCDLSGIRTLVVDDNRIACKITEEQLLARKMKVKLVNSGAEALNILLSAARNSFPYDVAVIDYLMAGMDGLELAHAIRSHEEISDISMILIASSPVKGDCKWVEEVGFEGYLLKPVAGSEVIRTLSAIWSAKQKNIPMPLITRQILRQKNSYRKSAQKENLHYEGVQILLVEDNSVNQMVTRKILTNQGCLVTSAGNGLEAVTLVKQQDFDLILMDCVMPEMDGYKATGIIIDYEKKNALKHTPIIAFTANAMRGDEEKCLAAGMDDYIAKPVQPEMMIDIMSRWLTSIMAEKVSKDKIKQEERRTRLIEPDVLDVLKSMTGESYIPILESYIKMADEAVPAISQAISSKDASTLRREAHSMKSCSMQIGAMQIGEMAGKIEKLSLDAKFDEISEIFPPISEMGRKVTAHLKDLIAHEIQ